MKNFDYPYINDSPVDLSGREGAPRIHDSDECDCPECQKARDYEREHAICDDISTVFADPFTRDWMTAPTFLRGEQDICRYWWLKGQQSANEKILAADVAEIGRMMKERLER